MLFFERSLKVHNSPLLELLSENFLLRGVCGASDPIIKKLKILLCNILHTRMHLRLDGMWQIVMIEDK